MQQDPVGSPREEGLVPLGSPLELFAQEVEVVVDQSVELVLMVLGLDRTARTWGRSQRKMRKPQALGQEAWEGAAI